MGVGAFLEPLVVVILLFGGAWINRAANVSFSRRQSRWRSPKPTSEARETSPESIESGPFGDSSKDALLGPSKGRSLSPSLLNVQADPWRKRELSFFGWHKEVISPNTAVFENRLLSRVLRKFPFLVECWYWALIYWTYQLGRAFTAVTLQGDTVDVARKHALQLIEIENRLGIFWELPVQRFFIRFPAIMTWVNWLYSFIHIPGTIAFLVWLYFYCITRNRLGEQQSGKPKGEIDGSPAGPELYQSRRRTMAVCNLLAFLVFTIWPCMPPRLLSDKSVEGPEGDLARSYGFVDTVHGKSGASSVWTQNRFCNQYAAMPSLHFGYSLLIGVSIATLPLAPQHRRSKTLMLPFFNRSHPSLAPRVRLPSWCRLGLVFLGIVYPSSILIAIVSTANHFILDAVAGAIVCGVGWHINPVLLNLLPVEDYFLWLLRIHKPMTEAISIRETDDDLDSEREIGIGVLNY